MRRAQITIFLLLGVVLLISVVILFIAYRSLHEGPGTGPVRVDESLARTCLVRTTDASLAALADDGVILMDESGPLPVPRDDQPPYLYTHYIPLGEQFPLSVEDQMAGIPPRQPLGDYSFIGLCDPDPDAPNGIDRVGGRRFTCDNVLYNYLDTDALGRDMPSIQEQLTTALNLQMRECIDAEGSAELIIQQSGILVRWNEPEVEYSPSVPLHLAFRAIQEVVSNEVTRTNFSPERMVDGMYPDRELQCDDCGFVEFTADPDKPLSEPGVDWYVVDVAGDVVIRFGIDDRNITRPRPDGSVSERQEHSVTCAGPAEDRVSCQPPIELLTVDDDELEMTWEDLPENVVFIQWLEQVRGHTCGYDVNGNGLIDSSEPSEPCEPDIPDAITKPSGDDFFSPERNIIDIQRGCVQPPEPLRIEVSDGLEAQTALEITLLGADPVTRAGTEVDCECIDC